MTGSVGEKTPRGSQRMCDDKGRLSPAITTKIESQLHGGKHLDLEANKLDLLISLIKIYSSIWKAILEYTYLRYSIQKILWCQGIIDEYECL